MYKVFYNDREVQLVTKEDCEKDYPSTRIEEYKNKKQLSRSLYDFFDQKEIKKLCITDNDPDKLLENVKSCFCFIEAGGGLVVNPLGQVLVIRRRGKWDLPKGKSNKKEKIEDTALREVREECGIHDLFIHDLIVTTYHTYSEKGRKCLKQTRWYLMTTSMNGGGTPQITEDITEVRWFGRHELSLITHDTYATILEVLAAAGMI